MPASQTDDAQKVLSALKKQQEVLQNIFSGKMESYSGEQISLMSGVKNRIDAAIESIEKGKDGEAFLFFAWNCIYCCDDFASLTLSEGMVSANKRLYARAIEEGR